MTPLCELAAKYKCDKLANHNYTPIYFEMFKDRRDTVRRVLEIGIGNPGHEANGFPIGASLRMWEEFFSNSEIIGLDWCKVAMINKGRIRSFFCDQSKEKSLRDTIATITAIYTPFNESVLFDVIIDDGSHNQFDQVLTVKTLMPYLAHDGFYIIEDVNKPHATEIMQHIDYVSSAFDTGDRIDDLLVVVRHAPTT